MDTDIPEKGESTESTILYELLIHSEWPQEPEVQVKGITDKSGGQKYSAGSFWRCLGPFAPTEYPPLVVQQLINQRLPWQFAVGGEGRVIAILQDQQLEIRSSRDDYSNVLGRIDVLKDTCPQWRKLMWSPDYTMLALAHSNGDVDIYDLIGAYLVTIENAQSNKNRDLGEAVAGLVFCDLRTKNTQWSYELLIINYKGNIRAYYVNPTDRFQESHEFSVAPYYPNGITNCLYHPSSQFLILAGKTTNFSDTSNAALLKGITLWRMLLGRPYYKLNLSLEDEMLLQKQSLWQRLNWRKRLADDQDVVLTMNFSPRQDMIAAVHASSLLTLWEFPSLRLKKYWDLPIQPNYSDINPQCESSLKKKATSLNMNLFKYYLSDVNWWSQDAIILARFSGALTVSSIYSLKNLLGISPEWFEPGVQISPSYDKGFLALECENVTTNKRKYSTGEYNDSDDISSDDEDMSFLSRSTGMMKKTMFFLTDSDRFRSPRKKMRFLNKTYRLLYLKSTTPEELFSRKLNNEEYGEALALAQTYNMDCDLVYQRQWRKSPATVAAIQDYLSKITKRSWVLHECIERVPETIDAAKELLMYGLRGTELQALITLGSGKDRGRFVAYQSLDEEESESDNYGFLVSIEELDEKKTQAENKRMELLKQIKFSKLSLEQKQLCEYRLKLLTYLDRLTTYEAILGGPGIADEFYDKNIFQKFRSQSGLEACITFAHQSNWQAIAAMFTYHGNQCLEHYLAILSNFPETTSAVDYQLLLPKLGYSKNGPVFGSWNEDKWRDADWCETKIQRTVSPPVTDDFIADFYEDNKQLLKYKGNVTIENLSEWYCQRAMEIESRSCLIENALDLIVLGMEKNVPNLQTLLDDLKTMETLVYECELPKDISLKEMQKMDDFEVVQLLMTKTSQDNFIKHVKTKAIPFLDRCEKRKRNTKEPLFRRYLVDVSKEDLMFCRMFIENSKQDHSDIIFTNTEYQMSTAFDCIYNCERNDNLKDICIILEHLTQQNIRGAKMKLYSEQISILTSHVRISELLEKNGSAASLGVVKAFGVDKNEIEKMLTKLTRTAGRRVPVLSEQSWVNLLMDVMELQNLVESHISKQECYEIFLESLLCSGRKDTINFAGKMMMNSQDDAKLNPLEFGHVSFKLPYKNSASLVLKAAQEFFNSSATLSDSCMSLALSCLHLIKDKPTAIEEELDLIASLRLLHEFQVTILPLQVRLCTDRITLVQQALQNTSKAYRSSQKLLKMAYLLRVCGSDRREREGKVLTLVAEAALDASDYDCCLNICTQLMEGSHNIGWNVCYNLGNCKEFSNVSARCNLMSFALVYCTSELLRDILKAKMQLELQVICDRVKFLVEDDFLIHSDDVDLLLESNAGGDLAATADLDNKSFWQTGQVLQTTSKTTKAVFSSVRNTQLWKDAVKWIKPNELPWEDNSFSESTKNKDLKSQGVCACYSGIVENAHSSDFEASYQRYARPDLSRQLEISSKLFRASLLEDTLKADIEKSGSNSNVVIDLAKAYIPEDTIYSLCLLLCTKEFDDVEKFFKKLPNTSITLQLKCLFYAIRVHLQLDDFSLTTYTGESTLSPDAMIRHVLDIMNSKEKVNIHPNIQEAFEYLKKYDKLLYDFLQAELLQSIGGGVNAARFTSDDVYKKETILGIAMTLDDRFFQIAVSFAHHYKMSLWDVHMAQLEFLFSESRLTTQVISARVNDLKLLQILQKQPHDFKEKLARFIYPSIDGKDHTRLLCYFNLLEQCGDLPDEAGIHPSTHSKLLGTKFKPFKNLDYKFLMKIDEPTAAYLPPLLSESNVHVYAKSAPKIPDGKGSFLNPSIVYGLWVTKYFYEGSGSTKSVPQSTTDWLHRYESCNDMLQRLLPEDFLHFIDKTVFSENALDHLQMECRSEIVKRAAKFCRQRELKIKDAEETTIWKMVLDQLQKYRTHLGRMEDPMLVELRSSDDRHMVSYVNDLDLTHSDSEEVKKVLIKVVIEGPDLPLLKTLLSCCPSQLEWGPTDAYLAAIRVVIDILREKDTSLICESPFVVLENILRDISKNGDELMIDDAIDVVHEFCRDTEAPITTRLSVLQLLEKTSYFSEEYSNLLLLYQTQTVIISIWPDYEVVEDDIMEDHQRQVFLEKLLNSCSSLDHFTSLAELLIHWPNFSTSVHNDNWEQVLCCLTSYEGNQGLDRVVYFFGEAQMQKPLSEKTCWKIYQEVSKQNSILHTLKYAFKTNCEEIHQNAIDMLKKYPTLTIKDFDEELLSLVLEKHLTSSVVSTCLYKFVIKYLLDHTERFSVSSIITELKDAQYHAEAGGLALLASKTHSALSTFSSSLQLLNKWISKRKS